MNQLTQSQFYPPTSYVGQPQQCLPCQGNGSGQPVDLSPSGVKININDPVGSKQVCGQSPYNVPMNPIYGGIPMASAYAPQAPVAPQANPYGQFPAPPYMPPMMPPQPQIVQNAPQPQPVTPSAPPVPPPAIDQVQSQATEQPQDSQAQNNDLQGSIDQRLQSTNPEEQTNAIVEIAQVMQSDNPQKAELLNENTINSLTGIMQTDTSTLEGQAKEQANSNKQGSVLALALIQSELLNQVNSQAAAQGMEPVSITQQTSDGQGFPGIEQVLNMAQNDSEPQNRIAAYSALEYVGRNSTDQDKQTLSQLFDTAAQQDSDPNVKQVAQAAKESLTPAAPAAEEVATESTQTEEAPAEEASAPAESAAPEEQTAEQPQAEEQEAA